MGSMTFSGRQTQFRGITSGREHKPFFMDSINRRNAKNKQKTSDIREEHREVLENREILLKSGDRSMIDRFGLRTV